MNTIRLNTIGEVVAKKKGGVVVVPPSDVNFYDSDGTILYSYTAEDFLALTELPALPKKEGLICQGWNWDIAKAQDNVRYCKRLDIGAMFIAEDEKTRLYISILDFEDKSVSIRFAQSSASGTVIDWGDGSQTDLATSTAYTVYKHTYPSIGEYVISLEVAEGNSIQFGGSNGYNIMGSSDIYSVANSSKLTKILLGRGCEQIASYAFYSNYALREIILPQGVTSIGINAFENCYSLESIVIPTDMLTLGNYLFKACYGLRKVIFPQTLGQIGNYAFHSCYSLESAILPPDVSLGNNIFYYAYSCKDAVLPKNLTTLPTYTLYSMYALRSLTLPDNLQTIENEALRKCYSLYYIAVPSSVNQINNTAFKECGGLRFIDFSKHSAVPTLGTGVFDNTTSLKIIVPDALYDEWIAATNWSNYASKIIKKSDWDASQS